MSEDDKNRLKEDVSQLRAQAVDVLERMRAAEPECDQARLDMVVVIGRLEGAEKQLGRA